MKKILLLIIPVILLTGCGAEAIDIEKNNNKYYMQDSINFDFYIDRETCVEYIRFTGGYKGGLTIRLNADGTPMLNEECLESKGK